MAIDTELRKQAASCRKSLKRARRIVIKLGTSVVTHENGELALGRLHHIVEEIAVLMRSGCQVILVSSGAVGLGAGRLGVNAALLPEKQACAAVGQVLLMSVYEQAFSRLRIAVAQVLLTEDDFSHRSRYLNLRNAFNTLLAMGVLPIVNENDPVSTAELEIKPTKGGVFGDNDRLSGLVMSKIDAEALLILSDVDGVYAPPGPNRGGQLIPEVDDIDSLCFADRAGVPTGLGRGGVQTKLEATRICIESGGIAVIANGKAERTIERVFKGENLGTIFVPRRRLSSRKRWIAFASEPVGRVTVTAGAREALEKRGASLLFAGVLSIEGAFARGDVLSIVDEQGNEFARGMANQKSAVARRLIGRHTREVTRLTQAPNFDSFVTRDNLVLVKG